VEGGWCQGNRLTPRHRRGCREAPSAAARA
jgi:hypothetical protein